MANWQRQLGAITNGAVRVTFDRPGRLQTIADTRAWVRAFFDGAVRGDWRDLKRLATGMQPEIAIQVFGKLWP